MKNVVKLTADELATVLDTIEATAIVQTLRETANADAVKNLNSINWQGVFSALFEMFDNGLTAMGIEITEDVEAMEEEEEDEKEDNDPIADMLYTLDDGRTAISFEDACFLMDMIKETGIERGLSEDEAIKAAKAIFLQIGKDYGIDEVTEEEEEEEEEVDDFGVPTDYWSEFDEEEEEEEEDEEDYPEAELFDLIVKFLFGQ